MTHNSPVWITGKTSSNPDAVFKITIKPSEFLNEATLEIAAKLNSHSAQNWLNLSVLQVIPVNASLILTDRAHDLVYDPCGKKNDFLFKDGPIIELKEATTTKNFELIRKYHLPLLQSVRDSDIQLRAILTYQGSQIVCKGLIKLGVPICQNMPGLKLLNSITI